MTGIDSYRQQAAECMRRANCEDAVQDKNILLNIALAWVRLAQQRQEFEQDLEPQTQHHVEFADSPTIDPDMAPEADAHIDAHAKALQRLVREAVS